MKMTKEDWKSVRYFTPDEWGDWGQVDRELIFLLDSIRHNAKKPVVIHCAYATAGHSEHSYHYRGMAVDFHILGMHVVDQFLLASQYSEVGGIGVYPYWRSPGLHIDLRPGRTMWGRTAKGTYLPLTWDFIQGIV